MWDWRRSVVLPLALEGLATSVRRQLAAFDRGHEPAGDRRRAWQDAVEQGTALLRRYFEWAPGVDRLSPVRVESDFEANLPDPARDDGELVLPDGRPVRYQGRLDLLVIDEHDAYWVVRHSLVDDFRTREELLLDQELVASCWAWERFHLGMRIAGTIHNELRATHPATGPTRPVRTGWRRLLPAAATGHRRGLPQHEASGGGRSVTYHQRSRVQTRPVEDATVTSQGNDVFRRTQIRRSPAEVAAMGAALASEALDMVDRGLRMYPSPTASTCAGCQFLAPCVVTNQGGDVRAVLAGGYRHRGPEQPERGRLGGATWGTGRGAAPP
jgi:hypothetical protein